MTALAWRICTRGRKLSDRDRVALEAIGRALGRRLALEDRGTAYRRRIRVRGRGTKRGRDLALAYFRRYRVSAPMFARPEARS